MRGIPSDERDSSWERDDARYRVYVFDGPDNAITTVDIVDASIEEALDAARTLSDRDARLWSLALVENDARGLRGLLWMSGMDYNDPPDSPRQWRRRRAMQERYLMARRKRHLPLVLPNGLRVIRLFPERTSGWPLWESFSDDYHLTGPDLDLSAPLSDALHAWNEAWSSRGLDDPLPAGWREEGHDLWRRLRLELDGIAEVRPDFLT